MSRTYRTNRTYEFRQSAAVFFENARVLFPEKSSSFDCRQKQPLCMQQFLNFRFESHGQGSFLPSFSTSSLNPCTMRTPRFTCVSDGNPFRRLLERSKKGAVFVIDVVCHI